MKLTIFGATGATGSCLAEQALAAGHEVTAVVRDPARLVIPAALRADVPAQPDGRPLRVITADIMDPAAITEAVTGVDGVLSAVGPRGTGPTSVDQAAAASIITAMQRAGTRRLIFVSGSVVTDTGEGPVMRYLLKPLLRRTILRHVCADMRRAEEQIRASPLDWTIMRPPRLTAGPATGQYRTAVDSNLRGGRTISRADLAACMLGLVGDPAAVGHNIGIAR